MIQKDVKNAVQQVRPSKKINGETIINQIHTRANGWQYYGKCVRDFVNDANKDPKFFNKVDRINIHGSDYEFASVLFEWEIIDITEFGPVVLGFAWHTNGYNLDEEFEAGGIAEMRYQVKQICKKYGWAFLDAGGPVDELRAAYLAQARAEKEGGF